MTDEMEISSPKYSFESPRRQYFSLPFGLVTRLLETEFPGVLLKLQKSCKHFFAKKKVVVVDTLIHQTNSKVFYFMTTKNGEYFEIAVDKGIQYWLTRITLGYDYSIIRSHIYRLTLTELNICWQTLSQNEIDFLLIDNKIEDFVLHQSKIRDVHGNPVPIDYILGKVPNVTRIKFWNDCEIYSNKLLKKLNSIKFNQKLSVFRLFMEQTSEEIDAEILGEFVKRNLASNGLVEYYFPGNAPESEAVQTKLQQIRIAWISSDGRKPLCYVRKGL